MQSTRFQILCADNLWRYVFCRSLNGSNQLTRSSVIPTETRAKAYVSYGAEQPDKDLVYFTEHANGRTVRTEQPMP